MSAWRRDPDPRSAPGARLAPAVLSALSTTVRSRAAEAASTTRTTVRRSVRQGVKVATPVARWTPLVVSVGVTAAFILAGASSALAGVFARVVVTPVRNHAETTQILAVVDGVDGREVILSADLHSVVPGTYSLTFDHGANMARIGEITSYDPRESTVARRVEEVYSGDLSLATRGRLTGTVYPHPRDAGFEAVDVEVPVEHGVAPAWRVDPPAENRPGTGEDIWAIMVHGRGARRNEGIRALPTTAKLGMTSLLISYRNDGDAPDAEDFRYGLGTTEWRDVEAAIRYALEQGASDVVVFGWSMGGAVALQTVDRSELSARVRGVVLTGPVIDWIDVLEHQARIKRIPEAVGWLGQWLLSNPAGRFITGLTAPVDLKSLNWVARADQLRVPTLVLHSEDDEYVPVGPSMEFAERNPRLVRFVRFTRARHTREWNVDPQRWDRTVRGWLRAVLTAQRPGVTSASPAPR